LVDCDLLFIPRLTRLGDGRPLDRPSIHNLSREQAEALKEVIKSGTPVLACLGPTSQEGPALPPAAAERDELERVLSGVGFRLNRQTVLFSDDTRDLEEGAIAFFRRSEPVKIPALDFAAVTPPDPRPDAKQFAWRPVNPLRRGLRVVSRSVGPGFELKLRF